jgi:hypothetical protein
VAWRAIKCVSDAAGAQALGTWNGAAVSLGTWNDTHTHAEVLAAFDAAIHNAEAA